MPSLWQALAGLRVRIDDYSVERRELAVSPEFTRVTTTVVLDGDGETGHGEDVTYTATDHDDFPDGEMLSGTWTLDEYSRRVDDLVALAGRAADGGVDRLPALGLRERGPRPRAPAGASARSPTSSGGRTGRSGSSRRRARRSTRTSRSTRRSSSSSTSTRTGIAR